MRTFCKSYLRCPEAMRLENLAKQPSREVFWQEVRITIELYRSSNILRSRLIEVLASWQCSEARRRLVAMPEE
jgi:hypothetical protein